MKGVRLGAKILRTLIKDRMQYPDRLIADTFAIVARCGILLLLYWYVFNLNGGTVNGIPYAIAAWSMFLYFAFSTLRLRDLSSEIMRDVQSGNVEVLLSKPVSYIAYRMWWQIGAGLYPFIVISITASIALAFIIGIPETMSIGLFVPTLIVTMLAAALLSLIIYTIVGLLAFWIEEIKPVFWMVDKAVMIMGGSYLPVALFPPLLYKLAVYSPFGASQFMTHTVYASWQTQWPTLIGFQLAWIVILGLVMIVMFTRARHKVSVNGG